MRDAYDSGVVEWLVFTHSKNIFSEDVYLRTVQYFDNINHLYQCIVC